MTETWLLATLWLGMALLATLLSIWFGIATALSEIVVGTVAQLIIGALLGSAVFGANDPWIKFLSGTGVIILTFLAGAELDPSIFKEKWKEAVGVGLASFIAPFLGCAAVALISPKELHRVEKSFPDLSSSYRRTIGTTLSFLDKAMCEF